MTDPGIWKTFLYDTVLWMLSLVFDCFFREIRPRGAFRIPKKGAVIFVAAPHANQFVDAGILAKQIRNEANRRISFLIAEKSMKVNGVGQLASLMMSIPVRRAQDNLKTAKGLVKLEGDFKIVGKDTTFTKDAMIKGLIGVKYGNVEIAEIISDTELIIKREFKSKAHKSLQEFTSYKLANKIDQREVYEKVFDHLGSGGSIGIFPEGGSHDRTDLLPLKAGVAIMALGAMVNNPDCDVKIVPCGMNYFHPHKFRSRAVVEFGEPIEISSTLLNKYKNSNKEAIADLLESVEQGLRAVTVTCPDYDTLMVVQAARRLYTRDKKLPIPLVVEINRRLVKGYQHFKDEDEIIQLREKILDYNQQLKNLHLPDHEVEKAQVQFWTNLTILVHRFIKLIILSILALPGAILFTPVFITGKWYSTKKKREALAASVVKIKANDVVATWKILIGMGLAPLLYTFYSILGIYYFRDTKKFSRFILFWLIYGAGSLVTYAALVIGDTGFDILKSIRPIYLSLIKPDILQDLKKTRRNLTEEIVEVVNKLGPKLFPDFDHLKNGDILDEVLEDLKTERLIKRRRERRRKELDNLSSDSEALSIFASSDNETDTSETSIESSGINGAEYSTGVRNKVVDALRERRQQVVDDEEGDDEEA